MSSWRESLAGLVRRASDALPHRRAPGPAETPAPGPGAATSATPTDLEMMRRAIDEAMRAFALDEAPVGAVVYRTATGEVLSAAHNRREIDHDPAAHAELLAIRDAAAKTGDWRLSDCTLVVTLEPCAMCAGLIVNARIGRLVFGASDPKAGAVVSLFRLCDDPRLNHRLTPIGGVLADECGGMLTEFFRTKRAR